MVTNRFDITKIIILSIFIYILVTIIVNYSYSQMVHIKVDILKGQQKISPYIYGRNNSLSSDPSNPLKESDWQLLRDAGVRIFRENGGNNSTKYNWKRKLSSHPDWYNNVYSGDWDYEVKQLQKNIPSAQGIWAFQLIGKAAATNQYNFDDWKYNQRKGWKGVHQNLAGGGTPNKKGKEKALIEGNSNLYTEDWPADSTVGILNHWFNDLKIDKNHVLYWNMDNEPEIWSGTHDDVMPVQLSAENFMQRYFEVAKKARAIFPEIKIAGPVSANEWQWYLWNNKTISYEGINYPWLEFFIKRIGEEQKKTGIKLLDVLDIHFYPYEDKPEDIVQLHRVFFDKNYVYPGANGIKQIGDSDKNDSLNKEYILERCRAWLEQYIGKNHGVGLGLSEFGIKDSNPNITAVCYASILGTFANQGVELFTPWYWETGMWEVLHLFSRYGQEIAVESISDNENQVSAYSSLSSDNKSLTIILVNRSLDKSQEVNIKFSNFTIKNGFYPVLFLNDLPSTETFKSHTDNHLEKKKTTVFNNNIILSLPKLSVTAVLLERK